MTVLSATAAPFDLARVRADFPALDQAVNGHPLAYLDSAATAQRPRPVLDALAEFYARDNANVHRGLHELSRRATERYEAARTRVARFLGAADAAEVAFVRGTTEAVNLVAWSWGGAEVGAGDEVVLTVAEHHSNIVPWQLLVQRTGARLRYVDVDDAGRVRLDELDAALAGGRVKLVALAHVSNVLGTIHPIAEVCERAHRAGAHVFVDGAQGAAHLKVDIAALGCDFYAFSGHKLGGPMGIGALWARRELLDAMTPWQGGGEMIDEVRPDRSTYAAVPHRFEAGTPNVAGAAGLAAALDYLDALGRDAQDAHENALVRYGLERLAAVPGVALHGPPVPDGRIAVFTFTFDGIHPHDLATILDAEGVAIRAGHHCAQLLMRRLGVGSTARASCFVYTAPEEIDRLVDGLESARRILAG